MQKSDANKYREKLVKLDSLLCETQWLWRPQPYKQRRPEWCERLPELCEKLLGLTDEEVQKLSGDSQVLANWLSDDLHLLKEITELTELPQIESASLRDLGPHFHSGIPGRKWQQIERFSESIGKVKQPLLEWCGGKGHLGRLLAAQWQQSVVTLEHNDKLCRDGERLATRSGVKQRFVKVDALSLPAGEIVKGHHAVALHACGELHRTLLRKSVETGLKSFDIVPCCYYLGADEEYQKFSSELQLVLTRDDLRLAVTETVTAVQREVIQRDREMAWKLGYAMLRANTIGDNSYRSIKPIRKEWLKSDFSEFCRQLAQRDGWELPSDCDWSYYQTLGRQRQREVMRLNLVRAAFRRAIEMWLVLDMTSYLVEQGYHVRLGVFCDRSLSPRNILISSRKL